jgi:hypothetical protein
VISAQNHSLGSIEATIGSSSPPRERNGIACEQDAEIQKDNP